MKQSNIFIIITDTKNFRRIAMRNWIMKFIKCNVLLGFLLVSLSKTAYGMEEQLNQAVVLPVDYHDKAFVRGEYVSIDGNYEIYLRDNTTFLPLRLMAYLISNDEEFWEARWDAAKPDEVVLVCTYMEKMDNGGWVNTGKPQTSIKLNVDSKNMLSKGETVELSAAPKKIGGRIVLPVRAVGEALNRQIAYKNGLIFVSKEPLALNDEQADGIINEMKERFKDTRKAVESFEIPLAVHNVNGKTYFNMYDFNESSQISIQRLYAQGEQGLVLMKEIKNYIPINQPFVEDVFYYGERQQTKVVLYGYNLNTNQTVQIGELNIEGQDFSWIDRIIPKENKIYFIAHYGDLTMGAETLYVIEKGKVEELTGAKQFGSIIIENDKIYYSNIHMMRKINNLYVYDESSKEVKNLGEEGYTYDINRILTSGGGESLSAANSLKLIGNKLYTIGYLEESDQAPCIYSIDLQTGEVKKLSLPTSQFWIVNDKIYYIETTTKYLITIDLEGNGKKTLISKPIAQAKFHGKSFYYTLLNKNNDLTMGLYKYTLDASEPVRISPKRVKDFFISSSKIYYMTTGYDAGLYKIQDGATVCLTKEPALYYHFDGEKMIFRSIYNSKIEIIQ